MKIPAARPAAAVAVALSGTAAAGPITSPMSFVDGIAISGGSLDLGSDSAFDRRVGFFSDLFYDPNRNEG